MPPGPCSGSRKWDAGPSSPLLLGLGVGGHRQGPELHEGQLWAEEGHWIRSPETKVWMVALPLAWYVTSDEFFSLCVWAALDQLISVSLKVLLCVC